jgi:hypothetical protein
VNDYAGAISDVSVETIAPVISSVYPADDSLVFVIIGDAEAIRDTVARYGQLVEMSILDGSFEPAAGRTGD